MLLEVKNGVRTNSTGRGQIPRTLSLKCDVCEINFERPYMKCLIEASIHRCSQKCVYGFRLSDGIGGRGAVETVRNKPCAFCGSQVIKRDYQKAKNIFCNVRCQAGWKKLHPEEYAANTAKMHTPEVVAKISVVALERMNQPGYVHPWQGKHHSIESKEAMSKTCKENRSHDGEKNGMFGQHHSKKAREAMSKAVSQRILDGNFRPYGTRNKKGWFTSTKTEREHFFRSSWEEAVMKYLDLSEIIQTWDYECVRIPYDYDDHKRWYVPDFVIMYADNRQEMWEVKPEQFLQTERVLRTSEAGRAYCQEHNMNYLLVTRQVMKEFGIIVS